MLTLPVVGAGIQYYAYDGYLLRRHVIVALLVAIHYNAHVSGLLLQ
ncbi:MAG: hypothetical protein OXH83_14855 [Bryobacterales bacterium]|nr:hypothetical protein [Bryobacterales bacterium]